jgi:putative ABC transport system permease protein
MKPRLSWRDLAGEALAGVAARPLRSALTVLGTVLGITTLVITLGVAATAGNQIAGRFDVVTATEVTVRSPAPMDKSRPPYVEWNALPQLTRLNGVQSAAAVARPSKTENARVRANELYDPTTVNDRTLPAVSATDSLPDVLDARLAHGRFFDSGHVARHDRVVVLGSAAAQILGITRVEDAPAVFVNNEPFTVIGILGTIARESEQGLASAVIIPHTTADDRLNIGPPTDILIRTTLGAAQLVAGQAPLALSPSDHAQLQVLAPPDPARLRGGIEHDVNGLFLVLGLVSLVVGAIGIANVTLVTVMERTGEIGLRRALGAARRHIALQFLVESSAIGLLGGVIGASVGTIAVVVVSVSREWTPVLDLTLAAGAPVVGALVGLLAGLYPALRAARLQPVDSLRSGT